MTVHPADVAADIWKRHFDTVTPDEFRARVDRLAERARTLEANAQRRIDLGHLASAHNGGGDQLAERVVDLHWFRVFALARELSETDEAAVGVSARAFDELLHELPSLTEADLPLLARLLAATERIAAACRHERLTSDERIRRGNVICSEADWASEVGAFVHGYAAGFRRATLNEHGGRRFGE